MAATRHQILYDTIPWRRNRVRLGLSGIALLLTSGLLRGLARDHSDVPNAIGLAGIILLAVLTGMYLRAKLSGVSVDAAGINLRIGRKRVLVAPDAVAGVRVVTLANLFAKSDRYRRRPMAVRWRAVAVVAVRLDPAAIDVPATADLLGNRLVYRGELVLPVAAADALHAECVAVMGKRVLGANRRRSAGRSAKTGRARPRR